MISLRIEIKLFKENFVFGMGFVRNGEYNFNNYQSCRLSKSLFIRSFCQSGFNWNSGKGDTTGAHELECRRSAVRRVLIKPRIVRCTNELINGEKRHCACPMHALDLFTRVKWFNYKVRVAGPPNKIHRRLHRRADRKFLVKWNLGIPDRRRGDNGAPS